MVKGEAHEAILAKGHLLQPVAEAIAHSPTSVQDHIPSTGGEGSTSLGICLLASYGVEFSVVVHLEVDGGVGQCLSLSVYDLYDDLTRVGIVIYDIDLRIGGGTTDDSLEAIIASEGLSMYEHGTRDGCVEPS